MAFLAVLGSVAAFVIAMMIATSGNKAHIAEHGVPQPSRKAFRRIEKRARDEGISFDEAYERWLKRKKALASRPNALGKNNGSSHS